MCLAICAHDKMLDCFCRLSRQYAFLEHILEILQLTCLHRFRNDSSSIAHTHYNISIEHSENKVITRSGLFENEIGPGVL